MKKLYSFYILILALFIFSGCSGSNEQSEKNRQKKVYSGVMGSSIQVSAGTNNESQPAVAYDREGRYLAVWSDERNSTATPAKGSDIYGKICDGSAASQGLNATPPVCSADFPIATGDGNQWQPKVAYDYNDKKYLIVFADTSAGYSIIKGQLITQAESATANGVFATPSFNVSTHLKTAEPSQIEPEVIYNDFAKKFTVAWLGTSNYDSVDYPASADDIYTTSPTWKAGDSKTITGANAIISVTLADGTPVSGYSVSPSTPSATDTTAVITLNANSNAIGKSSDLTIQYADTTKNNDDTTTAPNGVPTTVFAANDSFSITPGGSQTSLAIVYFFLDTNRVISATNTQQVRSGNNINAAILSGSNLIGQHIAYWTSFGLSKITWSAPAWRIGSTIVIDHVYNGANDNADDNTPDSPFKVTMSDGTDRTSDFTISISNNFLVASLNTGSPLIGTATSVTTTYRPIKNLIGPVTGQGCSNSYGPIGYAPLNHVGTSLIAYTDVTSAGIVSLSTAYSQMVFKESTDSGSAINILWTISENETKPRLAYNPLDGESFILWSGTQHPEELTIGYSKDAQTGLCNYSPTFTSETNNTQKVILRRWINNLASDTLLGNSAFYPSLSIDPTAKRLLVAWEEQNSSTFATTGKDINAQLFDLTNFVLYGSLINISGAVGDQTSPAASYDTVNQRHLIVWEDARNQSANLSNIDIYGQFIDPQGNLSGGNVPINVDEGNQLSPALSFGDANFRQFLLLWKDARVPGNSDIYGQLLKYSVLPQLVITDENDNPILNGALNFANVAVGQATPSEKKIRLRNDGNTTLTISSMSTPGAPFTFLTPAPVNINPGNYYEMRIGFQPTAAGSYTGNPSNSFKTAILSDGGNTTLYFSGTGDGINTLSISTTSIADTTPTVSQPSTLVKLSANGGVYPYTCEISSLPTGLIVDYVENGQDVDGVTNGANLRFDRKSGVLTQISLIPAGRYSIVFIVTDSNNPKSTSSPKNLTLNVGTLSINSNTNLSAWTLGVDYANAPVNSLTSSGAVGSIAWLITKGTIPGVILNANGAFSGLPTATGTFPLTVTATDSSSPAQTATADFAITINASPSILTTSLPSAIQGIAYSQILSSTGGTAPIIWSVTGGLPPGIIFNSGKGEFTGTPTSTGNFSLSIAATDSAGQTDTKQLNLTVNGTLGIATPTTGAGYPDVSVVGSVYNFVFKSNNGGIKPYTWNVVSGVLPAGLSIDKNTGVVSGTPTAAGTYDFTIELTDSVLSVVTKTFTISTISIGKTLNVQLVESTGNVSSYSSATSDELATVPTGYLVSNSAKMKIDSVTDGATIKVAVTFPSIPPSPHFFKFNGVQWTEFTPDQIISNTIIYQIKDRTSINDTDLIALRDTNPSAGVIDDPVVVTTQEGVNVSSPARVSASGGGGGGCFIATAAFGSYLDPHVMALRHFRDDVLLQSELGTAFVKFYYKYSPPIADFIYEHDTLRMIFRILLTPLIFAVEYPVVFVLLMIAGLAFMIAKRIKAKHPESVEVNV